MEIGTDTSGNAISVWFQHIHRPLFETLDKNINTEVCIIGCGITGLTTAYQLIKAGKKVVLIDDGRIGSGETGRTSAHLTNVLDDRYLNIERVHGKEGAKFAASSHTAAIDFIEHIIQKEKIDCDFSRVEGYLFPAKSDSFKTLEKEAAACERAGFRELKLLKNPPENTFRMKGCLQFPNQAEFHPLKYLSQLAKIIEKKGGYIYEMTHANNIVTKKKLSVKTSLGFTIHAKQIVVATNVPINDRYLIHTKQEANRTYMIGVFVPENTLKQGLYWDTGDPYHYIRVIKGDFNYKNQKCDMLIIGGEDHRVAEPPISYSECFKKLESWASTHFPTMLSIELHWSGQIIEPVDYLAFIGHNPLDNKNVYIATGDSGNGLTHGTLAGLLLSDLILKKENPWTALYNPSRKSFKRLPRYLKDNLETAATYLSYFSSSEIDNINQMSKESGKIISRGLEKIAVYRDKEGKFYECSAVCPHLKSIVHWNSAEKSWDCPAHGSRFTPCGDVINGPAISSLKSKIKKTHVEK